MADLDHLVPFPVSCTMRETPSLLVATINFYKKLPCDQDAVAMLTSLLPREALADFDWMRAGVSDGGEGAGRTWKYYLRVPRKIVEASGALSLGADPRAFHSACGSIQSHVSTAVVQ